MAKISVLMSVYNEKDEWLSMAIESILNQTYTDIEFIIVNDNPTDERICRILSDYAERDGRIRIVTNECNIGLVASLNHGLEYVTGEYVARMDADDFSHSDRFERQLEYSIRNCCDIVSSPINHINESGELINEGRSYRFAPDDISEAMRWGNIVCHPAMLVRKSAYDRLGGYRNVYAAEDYDLLLRAIEADMRIGLTDSILLDYRVRDNSISGKNRLYQFVILCYLSERIGKVNRIDPDTINKSVSSQVTDKKNETFIRATEYIRTASKSGKLKMLVYVFRALFTSRYAWKYLKNVIKLRKLKKHALCFDGQSNMQGE